MTVRVVKRELDIDEVGAQLREFETRYGLRSQDRANAFRGSDGKVTESSELRDWDTLVTLWAHWGSRSAPAKT